jgi:hypothetical protein
MVFGGLVCLWRAFDNGRFNTGLLHCLLVFHGRSQPSVLSIQSLACFGVLACHCGIFVDVIDFLSRLPVFISGVSVDYALPVGDLVRRVQRVLDLSWFGGARELSAHGVAYLFAHRLAVALLRWASHI